MPPFPRRVFQERRTPEGTPRTVGRPAVPGTQDEPMPTELSRPPNRAWLAGYVVHQEPPLEALQVEVRINGWPYQALLDSGSAVSLVQPTVLPPRVGAKACLPITCIHGDTRHVPARRVTVSAAPGSWPIEVGIVKDLPVPVLLGRDWPGFDCLLAATTQPASLAGNRRRRKSRQGPRRRPVLLASDSTRDSESPSQSTNLFYDVFQQVKGGGAFAKEQLGDERLKYCEYSRRRGYPATTSSNTSLCGPERPAVLYRTAERGGGETASGAAIKDRDRDGAGPLPSDRWPPGGAKHHTTDPRPFPLARPGCRRQAVLSGLSGMPTDVAPVPSTHSADSASHN